MSAPGAPEWATAEGPQRAPEDWKPPVPPGAEPESVRQALRAQVLGSTYAMAKGVLGFRDLTVQTHLPFGRFIDSGGTRKFALAPRDHLKTSIFTIADVVRRIAGDPNIRILIANETATNASKMLTRVEAVFERNHLFQWLFPEVIPDFSKVRRWSSMEMLVPRDADHVESTLEAIGVGGAVVSRHYDGIKLDDLVGKEASESQDVMKKTIDWYQYCESLLNHPVESWIHVYGTRWSFWDLYSWIEEHEPEISRFHRSAIQPNGEALWPERFPIEVLSRLRRKLGEYKFSTQYLNDPRDETGKSFQRSWLRYFTLRDGDCVPEDGTQRVPMGKLAKCMRLDPAIGERDDSCRTAIVVDGVDAEGRKFLLETWAKRCQPLEMMDQIFRFAKRYDVDTVGIEGVAYQRSIKFFLEQEAYRRNQWLDVFVFRTDTHQKKVSRIMGVQPFCERGEVYVQRTETQFLEEYDRFPFGKTMDLMDAWAYGPQMWAVPELDPEGPGDLPEWWDQRVHMDGRCATTGY